MIKPRILRADRIRFYVAGRGGQKFLTAAAAQGVKLDHIRALEKGYTARAAGRDWNRLSALAERGGWQLTMLARKGPGRLLERLSLRPGIPVGVFLFVVLFNWLSGYIWNIDFGPLGPDQQAAVRTFLSDRSICEGARADQNTLKKAQEALYLKADTYGWVSLNFTGGCLFLESTQAQAQSIPAQGEPLALYAKADAIILAEDVKSGFVKAKTGQTVAKDQLLVSVQKTDRSGNPVVQGAQGSITGRVTKVYTAEQPTAGEQKVLTGRSYAQNSYYLLGQRLDPNGGEPCPYPDYQLVTTLQPVTLGRLALPVQQTVRWYREQRAEPLVYSEATAQQLALRQCWRQLYRDFADAQPESSEQNFTLQNGTVSCRLRVTFTADIARQSPETLLGPQPKQG